MVYSSQAPKKKKTAKYSNLDKLEYYKYIFTLVLRPFTLAESINLLKPSVFSEATESTSKSKNK